MGGLLVDLVELIQADAEGAGDDAGAPEEEVPGADLGAEDIEMAFIQVGNGQACFAGAGRGSGQERHAKGEDDDDHPEPPLGPSGRAWHRHGTKLLQGPFAYPPAIRTAEPSYRVRYVVRIAT